MRILLSLLLTTLLIFSSCASSAPPLNRSVQHVTDSVGDGFCTAFSVNEKQRMFLTAAHCVDEEDLNIPNPYLFNHRIVVKKIDRQADLAVIQAVLGSPQLTLARQPVEPGAATSVYGFVRDREFPTVYKGTFKDHALWFNRELQQLTVVALFDMEIDSGQSGSPVMNAAGEVISVAQLWFYTEKLGGGPPWIILYEFVKDYLPIVPQTVVTPR